MATFLIRGQFLSILNNMAMGQWIGHQSLTGYLRLALIFVWGGGREGFHFCFSRVFCKCWQDFQVGGGAGRWAIVLWGLYTLLKFPNFLSFKSFGNSWDTMYISNNRWSFHLWWTENLVQHQRVSKYYENVWWYH